MGALLFWAGFAGLTGQSFALSWMEGIWEWGVGAMGLTVVIAMSKRQVALAQCFYASVSRGMGTHCLETGTYLDTDVNLERLRDELVHRVKTQSLLHVRLGSRRCLCPRISSEMCLWLPSPLANTIQVLLSDLRLPPERRPSGSPPWSAGARQ